MLLDRCNVSDRDSVTIISPTAEALGHDIQKLTVTRSTERVRWQKFQ